MLRFSLETALVMDREPKLNHWGYYVGRPQRLSTGKRETVEEHHIRFSKEREELLSDRAAEQFLRALVLVQRFKTTKNFNLRTGSYGLKHRAEEIDCTFPDGVKLGPNYVANGSLIVAAVHAGFRFKTIMDDLGYEDVNVVFNMSRESIDDALFAFGLDLPVERAHRAARRARIAKSWAIR